MVYLFDYDPEHSRRLGLGTLGTVVFVEIGLAIGGGFGPCFVTALVLTPAARGRWSTTCAVSRSSVYGARCTWDGATPIAVVSAVEPLTRPSSASWVNRVCNGARCGGV